MIVKLSVFVPLNNGGTKIHIFDVEADQSLSWFKNHADEMASTFVPGVQYNALNVELP